MSGLFGMPPNAPPVNPPPPVPTLNDEAVQARASESLRQRQGRASTFMTNPLTQSTPSPSKQKTLGAA